MLWNSIGGAFLTYNASMFGICATPAGTGAGLAWHACTFTV